MMKPICIIPARGGSKGIHKKNIRPIGGKPLIYYTIKSCLKSKIFSHVIVSTEDKQIASIAKKYGAEVPYMRPKRLAGDYVPMHPVIEYTVKKLLSMGYEFDIFVLRDCTVPFIQNKDIQGAVDLLKKKRAGLVLGVYEQHLNPYYNILELNSKGFLKIVKPLKRKPRARQEAPKVFQGNGLLVYNAKFFLKSNQYKKDQLSNAIPYEIPIDTGLMIDTEFEFQVAKLMIENNYFKHRKL